MTRGIERLIVVDCDHGGLAGGRQAVQIDRLPGDEHVHASRVERVGASICALRDASFMLSLRRPFGNGGGIFANISSLSKSFSRYTDGSEFVSAVFGHRRGGSCVRTCGTDDGVGRTWSSVERKNPHGHGTGSAEKESNFRTHEGRGFVCLEEKNGRRRRRFLLFSSYHVNQSRHVVERGLAVTRRERKKRSR